MIPWIAPGTSVLAIALRQSVDRNRTAGEISDQVSLTWTETDGTRQAISWIDENGQEQVLTWTGAGWAAG